MGIRRAGLEESLRQQGVQAQVLETVRLDARKQGIPMHEAIRRAHGLDPLAVARALSELSGLPILETVDVEVIEAAVVRQWPLRLAEEHGLLPLYVADGQLIVALSDLHAMSSLDDLRVLVDKPVRPVLMPSDVLKTTIGKAYEMARVTASSVLEAAEEEEEEADVDLSLEDADLLDDESDAVIIRFANALVAEAIKERASDIHIEPYEKDLVVRFRIDGVLHEKHRPPARFRNAIVARIKIMAGLNIAEKRLPQDGRIRKRMGGREIDLRISTLPVRHGERVVMRILEKGEVFSLDRIGMGPAILPTFRQMIRKPYGILLVSGPTGSGKSTTLYSGISEINSPDKNILTIEDPVEYEMKGIGQVQVNPKIQLTFASALRSFLRQDPDVILVGEIRDRETAANAVQASLTGHLVFSTIHTNDAAGAFARMVDMGVEPFLVASSLLGVLAQRLVRQLCETCKEPYTPSDAELDDLGLHRHEVPGKVWRAVGCPECGNYGYRGRLGIFELLVATEDIKNLVIRSSEAGAIKKEAVAGGMITLRDDGIRKALAGVTTFDEVLRVTREDTIEA